MANERRDSDEGVRDLGRGGDAGEGSHSAFGKETGSGTHHNDERLGGRGRNPGREESSLLEDPEGAAGERRHSDESDTGPGEVRGLTPPDRDDVGA